MEQNTISWPVRNVGYGTAIRYFGWGFGELLLPIFIFSFVNNYTDTGLIASVYEISAIFSLPLIGFVADRWGAKKLLIVSLLMYPFLSFSYFCAGVLGIMLFIILARLINGVAYSLYKVGEKTVARMYASDSVGSNIGFIESFAHLLWIAAALLGAVRVATTNIPVYYLLLLIAPTSLMALYYIRKLPKQKIPLHPHSKVHHYSDIRRKLKNISPKLKSYAYIYTLRNAFASVLGLIIPLYIYVDTANIYLVVISGILMSIPGLFSYYIGKTADKHGKEGIWGGFVGIGLLFLSFIMIPWYPAKLFILFLLSLVSLFIVLALDNQSNKFVKKDEYGRMEATFEVYAAVGSMIGPIVAGVFMDRRGINTLMLMGGICALATSIFVYHSAHPQEKHHAQRLQHQ